MSKRNGKAAGWVMMPCKRCDGTGKEAAPHWYEPAMRWMRSATENSAWRAGGFTLEEVEEALGWPHQTAVRRMEILLRGHLVRRKRLGRRFLWFADAS